MFDFIFFSKLIENISLNTAVFSIIFNLSFFFYFTSSATQISLQSVFQPEIIQRNSNLTSRLWFSHAIFYLKIYYDFFYKYFELTFSIFIIYSSNYLNGHFFILFFLSFHPIMFYGRCYSVFLQTHQLCYTFLSTCTQLQHFLQLKFTKEHICSSVKFNKKHLNLLCYGLKQYKAHNLQQCKRALIFSSNLLSSCSHYKCICTYICIWPVEVLRNSMLSTIVAKINNMPGEYQ